MTEAPERRRGRPPKLSREQIVRDVAALLIEEPEVPLTVARIAEAIDASPMSIYRHFADRDELVASVAQHLMVESRPPLADDVVWQDRVRAWMRHLFDQAVRVPQLTQLVVTGESRAWVQSSADLAGILSGAGFSDDAQLADAVYWVSTTTLGQALIEANGRQSFAADDVRTAAARLSDEQRADFARIVPFLEAHHHDHVDRVIDWTVLALERALERPAPRPRPTRRKR